MSLTKYKRPFDSFFGDAYPTLSDSLFRTPFFERDWQPKQCAVDLKDNQLHIAFSVQGHDPKNVNVEYSDKNITITAKTNSEASKDGVLSQYIRNFTQTIALTDEYNGDSAVAEIKNGILTIVIPKAEKFVKKPKTLDIKY